jgi:hypothetical protein
VSSFHYFSFNDLGNLVGRVAHSVGLKLGHDGLTYKFFAQERHVFREIKLLDDWEQILPILGYSWERYKQGFNTLEDIFEFFVSSPLFNKAIYALENRNHAARTRDQKRKTYMEFLKWLESYEETNTQNGNKYRDQLSFLFERITGFEDTYKAVQAEWDQEVLFKSRYSGDVVRDVTGLTGKPLGEFMKWHKEVYGADKIKRDVIKMNPNVIGCWIQNLKERFDREKNEFQSGKESLPVP